MHSSTERKFNPMGCSVRTFICGRLSRNIWPGLSYSSWMDKESKQCSCAIHAAFQHICRTHKAGLEGTLFMFQQLPVIKHTPFLLFHMVLTILHMLSSQSLAQTLKSCIQDNNKRKKMNTTHSSLFFF